MPEQFHKFWAKPGTGKVLLGEVSTVADEAADNNFPEYSGRLPAIEEDVPPKYLIFNDYALLMNHSEWPKTWKK
jgi:D-lyxose ketol-isomerase